MTRSAHGTGRRKIGINPVHDSEKRVTAMHTIRKEDATGAATPLPPPKKHTYQGAVNILPLFYCCTGL
jgi:hypothetical protein